ncbi:MAG: hypothetical protein ACRC78_02685 [Planktothrix sp.]
MLLCDQFTNVLLNLFNQQPVLSNQIVVDGTRRITFHSDDPGPLGIDNDTGLPFADFTDLYERFNQTLLYVNEAIDRYSTDNVDTIAITASAPSVVTVSWILISGRNITDYPNMPIVRIPLLNPITTVIGQPYEIPIGDLNLSFRGMPRPTAESIFSGICNGGGGGLQYRSDYQISLWQSGTIDSLANELTFFPSTGLTRQPIPIGTTWSTPSGSPLEVRYLQQIRFGITVIPVSIGAVAIRQFQSNETHYVKLYDPPIVVPVNREVFLLPNSFTLSLS